MGTCLKFLKCIRGKTLEKKKTLNHVTQQTYRAAETCANSRHEFPSNPCYIDLTSICPIQ